ncbi:MAG: hypothetical protein LUQ24_06935 [Methanobacterium sp.]|nr:hypothetical protein [Methanobacterium sp.]
MRVWVERRVEVTDDKVTKVMYEYLLGRDVEIPDILFLKSFEVKIGLSFFWIDPEKCFYDALEHRMLCRLDELKMCEEEWESAKEMYVKSGFEVMTVTK